MNHNEQQNIFSTEQIAHFLILLELFGDAGQRVVNFTLWLVLLKLEKPRVRLTDFKNEY